LIGTVLLAGCQSVRTFADLPPTTGSGAEECLIDFSKKIKGHTLVDGPLPADLDAAKFFRLLEPDYPDKTCLEKVQVYPIKVISQDDSYVLFLCDPERRWVLYEDWGKTTDRVDRPYVRERTEVSCPLW
jgi:hypothetical protein